MMSFTNLIYNVHLLDLLHGFVGVITFSSFCLFLFFLVLFCFVSFCFVFKIRVYGNICPPTKKKKKIKIKGWRGRGENWILDKRTDTTSVETDKRKYTENLMWILTLISPNVSLSERSLFSFTGHLEKGSYFFRFSMPLTLSLKSFVHQCRTTFS